MRIETLADMDKLIDETTEAIKSMQTQQDAEKAKLLLLGAVACILAFIARQGEAKNKGGGKPK